MLGCFWCRRHGRLPGWVKSWLWRFQIRLFSNYFRLGHPAVLEVNLFLGFTRLLKKWSVRLADLACEQLILITTNHGHHLCLEELQLGLHKYLLALFIGLCRVCGHVSRLATVVSNRLEVGFLVQVELRIDLYYENVLVFLYTVLEVSWDAMVVCKDIHELFSVDQRSLLFNYFLKWHWHHCNHHI